MCVTVRGVCDGMRQDLEIDVRSAEIEDTAEGFNLVTRERDKHIIQLGKEQKHLKSTW